MRSAVGHYKAGRDNGDRKEGKMASEIRERIIDTAWKLFHEKGFSETTINDIIREAEISKGTFYYYFRSKDNMLDTLSVILDAEYERLAAEIPEDMDSFDKLLKINYEVHSFINDNIDYRLLAYLYSTQITKDQSSSLLDRNRFYFRFLEQIIEEGRRKGELTEELSVSETVKFYSLEERALVTDWCMNNGNYHLCEYSKKMFPMMIAGLRK